MYFVYFHSYYMWFYFYNIFIFDLNLIYYYFVSEKFRRKTSLNLERFLGLFFILANHLNWFIIFFSKIIYMPLFIYRNKIKLFLNINNRITLYRFIVELDYLIEWYTPFGFEKIKNMCWSFGEGYTEKKRQRAIRRIKWRKGRSKNINLIADDRSGLNELMGDELKKMQDFLKKKELLFEKIDSILGSFEEKNNKPEDF